MADTLYILSSEEADLLRSALRRKRDRARESVPIKTDVISRVQSSSFYVAKTPPGGIAARFGNVPSVATCQIYEARLNQATGQVELLSVGFSQPVYNISTFAAAENDYTIVNREKYGKWVIDRCCSDPVAPCVTSGGVPGNFTGPAAGWITDSGLWFTDSIDRCAATLDSNAAMLYTPMPPATLPMGDWVSNFRVAGTFGSLMTTRSGNIANSGRLIFGRTSVGNFWFVDLTHTSTVPGVHPITGAPGFSRTYTITLGKMEDNTTTTIKQSQRVLFAVATSLFLPPLGIEVCYQGGWITAQIAWEKASVNNELIFTWALQHQETPPQGLFGVGSQQNPTNPVSWKALTITINQHPPVCYECVNGYCCDGYKVPETVTLTLANFTGPNAVWNGSYPLIPFVDDRETYSSSITAPSLKEYCVWRDDFRLANPLPPPYVINYSRIEIARGPINPITGVRKTAVALKMELVPLASLFFRAERDIPTSDPFTVSPCHDQWKRLTFPDTFGGTADIVGDV